MSSHVHGGRMHNRRLPAMLACELGASAERCATEVAVPSRDCLLFGADIWGSLTQSFVTLGSAGHEAADRARHFPASDYAEFETRRAPALRSTGGDDCPGLLRQEAVAPRTGIGCGCALLETEYKFLPVHHAVGANFVAAKRDAWSPCAVPSPSSLRYGPTSATSGLATSRPSASSIPSSKPNSGDWR